jgi:hypothetical protein
MNDQIEKQAIEEMRKDLVEVFDEEYEKRRIITADFTAIKMVAKGYRKQEWISVEERLPKDSERVLVYGEKGICFATRYKRDWLTPMRYNGEITHWMPLPAPPKMKGD